eukprot:scaffold108537_cov27-Prasinocladus_malaysianus.AAC.1
MWTTEPICDLFKTGLVLEDRRGPESMGLKSSKFIATSDARPCPRKTVNCSSRFRRNESVVDGFPVTSQE